MLSKEVSRTMDLMLLLQLGTSWVLGLLCHLELWSDQAIQVLQAHLALLAHHTWLFVISVYSASYALRLSWIIHPSISFARKEWILPSTSALLISKTIVLTNSEPKWCIYGLTSNKLSKYCSFKTILQFMTSSIGFHVSHDSLLLWLISAHCLLLMWLEKYFFREFMWQPSTRWLGYSLFFFMHFQANVMFFLL